jgi:hypothetical protein
MIFTKLTTKLKKQPSLFGLNKIGWLIIYFLPLLIITILIIKNNWSGFSWPRLFLKKAPPSQEETSQLSWLSTSGRFIVDEKNTPIILRGINLSSVSWGYHDWFPEAIRAAANDWGINVIRTRVYQDDYFANPESFFALMEKTIVDPARQQGVYVILNPWIGNNESLPNDQTIIFWQEVARHYQNDPAIIFDVLAEPHDVDRTQVWEANQKLIEAIRQVHPKSLIMVTGVGWGREINSYLDNPLPYENIIYRTNPYNKAGEFEAIFGQIARFYPVFLGEFGADGYPPMSQDSVGELLKLANQLSLGWTAWNFHSVGCPCLLANYETYQPSTYGQIVKKALELPLAISQDELVLKYVDKKIVIYSDYLENNFRDLSWDAEVNLANQKEAVLDQKSIEVSFTKKHGAFYLSSYLPHRLDHHQVLALQINASSLAGFTVNLVDDQGKQMIEQAIGQFGQTKNNGWYQVGIPLSILNPSNKPISGLLIKNPLDDQTTFWLDNIYFE